MVEISICNEPYSDPAIPMRALSFVKLNANALGKMNPQPMVIKNNNGTKKINLVPKK